MDPLSITATCIALVSTITKTSLLVGGFVKDVRAARSDLDGVSRELLSLKTVLELLADDVTDSTNESLPQTLQKQITGIITNCTGVVLDIEETLKKHEGGKLGKAAQWVAFGKNDVVKLRSSLEAHKSALEIALEMVTLTMARGIKADTQELLNDTHAIKEDTAQILAEIARLQEQLPRDAQRNHTSGFMLERYLDNLTSYAETVYDTLSDNIDEYRSAESGSIKQQRSTSPISRQSSIAGEARITENDHTAQSIAPWSPEDREGKLDAPEEYLKPNQNAAHVARESMGQEILRRLSTRRPQHASDPWFVARAETQPVEQSRARTPPMPTNSLGIIGPREIIRERAAREAGRDYIGISKNVSVPPKVFQQDRQVSEAGVARNQTIAAHTAQSNSLRSDPQKQMDNVSPAENIYRRPLREPFGAGELSPSTDQNQSDGNALPQPRSAAQKAKSLGHARKESIIARRARREALREANDSREGGVDSSNASDMSTTPSASSMDIKPVFLKGLFSVSTTSTKPVRAICADIVRVLNQLEVKFTKLQGGFSCRYVPSVDLIRGDLPAARHRPRNSFEGFTNGRDLNHSNSDVESINPDMFRSIGGTWEPLQSELGDPMVLEFEIFVVKVPLLSLHGIQFKKLAGGTWPYKSIAGNILRELRL